MKFAERLARESDGAWSEHYVSYDTLKRIIKRRDADDFPAALVAEVSRASWFFYAQEDLLQHTMNGMLKSKSRGVSVDVVALHEIKVDAAKLQKFQVLNYLAVVKAVKKYNRWLAAPESGNARLSAIHFMEDAYFFKSLTLASVKTRLDVLESELTLSGVSSRSTVDQEREKYTCPICLCVLRQPVALSCAHLFCWGCLLSLTTAVSLSSSANDDAIDDAKEADADVDAMDVVNPHPHTTFKCPCCRKEELLDVDRLQVDPVLDEYLMTIKSEDEAMADACIQVEEVPTLLPPLRPEFKNRLTLCLDLDGTLVTTVNPRRAPALPECMVTYTVGKGGKLNPGGIFVIERPGLGDFLKRAACLCEVVLFTAGLEDYAKPILDEMERRYGSVFHHRLYRDATTPTTSYPCVKDMSRLGRSLDKCILVDDTPLAFLKQPDHGVPVLQYRGDVDDRLLPEAVEPLLFSLIKERNVPKALRRRFNMHNWFESQGISSEAVDARPKVPKTADVCVTADSSTKPPFVCVRHGDPIHDQIAAHETMLVADFDKTITDWDAAERLCDDLCPELTSLLSAADELACYVPMTNAVLSEMTRRGVSRDAIVRSLAKQGTDVPEGARKLLRLAQSNRVDCYVLSDANETFIGHVLAAAKLKACVMEVVTNHCSWSGPNLVVAPRSANDHGCANGCPSNMCKGRELAAMISRRMRVTKRVVYVGDGANDHCAVLSLGPNDVALVRRGYPLEQRIAADAGSVKCRVLLWDWHADLPDLLRQAT